MAAASTVLMWLAAAGSLIASAVSWFSPKCRKNYLPSKMVNSSLFVLTAVFASLSAGTDSVYPVLITAGLVFGLIGDFFLEWKNGKLFYLGVLSFSVNHLFYIYSFIRLFDTDIMKYEKDMLITLAVVIAAGIVNIIFEKIKFEGFAKVMLIYSAVLIASFIFSLFRGVSSIIDDGNTVFGILIAAAGAFFIASDTFLAAQLYGKSHFKHPEAFVLFFYFPAQTLFALSIHFFK